jgi:hypothetical protein
VWGRNGAVAEDAAGGAVAVAADKDWHTRDLGGQKGDFEKPVQQPLEGRIEGPGQRQVQPQIEVWAVLHVPCHPACY